MLRLDASVTELLPPPAIGSVTPNTIASSLVQISISGTGFSSTPSVALRNQNQLYQLAGETLIDSTQITGFVVQSQIQQGLYDLEVTNGDGQLGILENAFTAQ